MQLFRKTRKSHKRKPSVGKKNSIENAAKTEVMTDSGAADSEETAPVRPEEENVEFEKANADRVFHYFREISAIPHGSHHTKAARTPNPLRCRDISTWSLPVSLTRRSIF